MLLNLDEINDKVNSNKEKIANTDKTIQQKVKDLTTLLENSDSKKEMLSQIEEMN